MIAFEIADIARASTIYSATVLANSHNRYAIDCATVAPSKYGVRGFVAGNSVCFTNIGNPAV
ncbi:hypothetical protein AS156_25225 [Bradyrhizobium macuxiense]|uniref:Uncharacterized protein n=1 Tax=Bradyrhizobium macuxiense TaxID=1755647 RepID=A0A109J6T1_9BRAD|nr:hypothetical protein AS156_25225 [Bradyrhizobium macuxiense]